MLKHLIDFIPIVLIYMFVVHPKDSVLFSNTSLGKLIAISLIIFYSSYKLVYGFFVCVLILFYYQTDIVNDILKPNMDYPYILEGAEGADPETMPLEDTPNSDLEFVNINAKQTVLPYVPYEESVNTYEPSVPYNERNEDILSGKDEKAELKAIFRKQFCVDGQVTDEASEYYTKTTGCNPCDETCEFSVIEERLKTETELIPKESNSVEVFTQLAESIPAYFSQYIPNWNIAAYV